MIFLSASLLPKHTKSSWAIILGYSFFFIPTILKFIFKKHLLDFPGGPGVKNPLAKAEDMGSIPGPGRFHVL